MRFKVCLFFIFFPFFCYSCGVKKEIIPRYRFELGKPVAYNMNGDGDLLVDMGLLSYNSKILFGARLIFTPVETNQYGYKVRLDVKEPVIEGVSNQIQAAYFIGVNSLRKLLSEFYIDEFGKTKVFFNNVEIYYLSYVLNIFFGELSNFKERVSFSTNIPGWIMKTPVISKYSEESYLKENDGRNLVFFQTARLISFDKEDLEKSVEPKPLGDASYELTGRFDIKKGMMFKREAKFKLKYDIPVKQGFINTYIRIECNGKLNLVTSDLEI